MRVAGFATACFAAVLGGYVWHGEPRVAAQQQQAAPAPGAPGQNATGTQSQPSGEHGGQVPATPAAAYPERPKAPQAVLDRGKSVFSVNCAFCHGSDAGGGSVGPNLLRSEVVLQDKRGELIAPIVHGSRQAQGMPKIDLNEAQIGEVADWLHSLKTGGNMRSTEKINIVVGNAEAGKAAFGRICASCHSVDGDLKGFAAKFQDPRAMQQAWLIPGMNAGGRASSSAPPVKLNVPPVTATVIRANGQKVTGKLEVLDAFYVAVTSEDGVTHRFSRTNGLPKVDLHDPLEAHRALLRTYDDKDIHDITAYLQSLK